jgi:hypothetical protein
LAERLAWARENHVQPPDDVLAEAKAEGIAWQSPAKDDCCAIHTASGPVAWASAHAAVNVEDSGTSTKAHTTAVAVDGVVLLKMLECQGIGGNWLAAIVSLPPPAAVHWEMDLNRMGSVSLVDRLAQSLAADLATPPPRLFAV